MGFLASNHYFGYFLNRPLENVAVHDPDPTPTEVLLDELGSHSLRTIKPVDLSPDAVQLLIVNWRDALLRLSYAERQGADLRASVDKLQRKNANLSVDVATLREGRKLEPYHIIISLLAGIAGGVLVSDPANPLGYAVLLGALVIVTLSILQGKKNDNQKNTREDHTDS